jgi:hypothetical protein
VWQGLTKKKHLDKDTRTNQQNKHHLFDTGEGLSTH